MRRIQFQVRDGDGDDEYNGLPPNKKGGDAPLNRLNALKEAAAEAMKLQDFKLFVNDVRLVLCVHVGLDTEGRKGDTGSGDLDNFVAGVCDGLKKVAFDDDKRVVQITAEKLVGPDTYSWYDVIVEGE